MARMYPAQISRDTASNAERLLFRAFAEQLSDDYVVMHGVKWLTRHRRYDELGEVDFVIVHPRRGVLLLEVKGGLIRGEWAEEGWTSTSRGGVEREIKNPIRQLDRSFWALRTKLDDYEGTRSFSIPVYRGVAFPETLADGVTFGIDWDRQLVLDSADLNDVDHAVVRMYSREPEHDPLPKAATDALIALLQPTVVLQRPGLVAEMRSGELVMLRLSEEQSRLLRTVRNQRRAVVNGCAGSGKTMLAVEKALQLAEEGFSVLLTCFNKGLSEWMQEVVNRQGAALAGHIRVSHYHDLAVKLCEEAGHPSVVRAGEQSYWDDDLPDDLQAAMPFLETRFDAVVVDEGQDFRDNWWVTIQDLLSDPDDGVMYIFQDPHQAIYQRTSELPIATPPLLLEHNYRSTTAIHGRVIDFYDGFPKPGSIGPEGRPIELVEPSGKGVDDDVRRVLARLFHEEGLEPHQVVVLTPFGRTRSKLKDGQKVGNVALAWNQRSAPGTVRVSSVHSFKGLESDVVILVEPEGLSRGRNAHRLVYVALSRAKHHLVLIGELPEIQVPLGV